jgi:hypothetical protein
LTAPVAADQQGLRAIPGQSFGSGGQGKYKLPLELNVNRSWITDQGEVRIEVSVRNIGGVPLELPASRNLTQIEKPGNNAQHLFWIMVHPEADKSSRNIGGVAVGGSTSVPGSLIKLAPGESLRVLIQVSHAEIETAFNGSQRKQLEARVVCQEWRLEEDRYSIAASSEDVASGNVVQFVLGDGLAVVVRP